MQAKSQPNKSVEKEASTPKHFIDLILQQNLHQEDELMKNTMQHEKIINMGTNLHRQHFQHMYVTHGSRVSQNYVSQEVFEQVINSIQERMQTIVINNQTIMQIQEKQIELEQRVLNLEQLAHAEIARPQPSPQIIEVTKQQKNLFDIDFIRKEIKRYIDEVQERIDSQLQKFIKQGKDIDMKLSNLNEKQVSNQSILKQYDEQLKLMTQKIESTRSECVEKINSYSEYFSVNYKNSSESIQFNSQLRDQIENMDRDILKIFQQIKSLLDMDFTQNLIKNELAKIKDILSDQQEQIKDLYESK